MVLTGSLFDYQLMCVAATGLPQDVMAYQGMGLQRALAVGLVRILPVEDMSVAICGVVATVVDGDVTSHVSCSERL